MFVTAMEALTYAMPPREKSAGVPRLGLNPFGAIMALTLLSLLVICGASGWMQVTERYFGVAWVQDTHTYTSYALAGLVPLHVLGVLSNSILNGENLVRAMITGRRQR
jgi:cytochrome b